MPEYCVFIFDLGWSRRTFAYYKNMNTKPKFPGSFAIAAIVKNEGLYIEEWIAYHLLMGASHIRIFDNGSSDDTCEKACRMAWGEHVEVVEWLDNGRDFNETQKMAYANAAAHFRGVVDFVAYIDVDEFLVVDQEHTLADILAAFDEDVGAIACQQIVFGSSGETSWRDDFVTSRFTQCADPAYHENLWFKTIARPERVVSIETVHSVRTTGKYVFVDGSPLTRPTENPRFATRPVHHPIRLHHYLLKSLSEFRSKQSKIADSGLSAAMKERYNDGAFFGRDSRINMVTNLELALKREQLLQFLQCKKNS